MNWVQTSERLPEAMNDFYVISVTRGNFTFLAVAYFMKLENQWIYMEKGSQMEVVTDTVNAWVENIGQY